MRQFRDEKIEKRIQMDGIKIGIIEGQIERQANISIYKYIKDLLRYRQIFEQIVQEKCIIDNQINIVKENSIDIQIDRY